MLLQVSSVFSPGNFQGFTLVNRQRTNRISTGFTVEISTEGTQLSYSNFDYLGQEPHYWQLPGVYQGDKVSIKSTYSTMAKSVEQSRNRNSLMLSIMDWAASETRRPLLLLLFLFCCYFLLFMLNLSFKPLRAHFFLCNLFACCYCVFLCYCVLNLHFHRASLSVLLYNVKHLCLLLSISLESIFIYSYETSTTGTVTVWPFGIWCVVWHGTGSHTYCVSFSK